MDWDDLRYFLATARAGSLQGASNALGVNHSTVFRRINRFEKDVGARLFDRLPSGYALTTAGEQLLVHADRIAEEVDRLELQILGKDYHPSGTIRLTAPDNLAYEFLPAYLASFSAQYPDISLEIVVGAETLDLTRREADLAVRATASAPPPHLVGRRVCTLGWAFYAAEVGGETAGRPASQDDLAGHRLISADGALRRLGPFRAIESRYGDAIVARCSTLNAMSALAEAGYGIALLPDDQVKPSLVRLFEFSPKFVSDIWLLTHPELRRTERIRLMMNHLYEAFRSDPRIRDLAVS